MRNQLRVVGAVMVAISASATSVALAEQNRGMFLCRSPIIANNLWSDIIEVKRKGIDPTFAIVQSLAKNNECAFAASLALKPVKFVAGQFQMFDGKSSGWVHPDYYIFYVNS